MAHFFIDESLRAEDCPVGALATIIGAEARHAVTVSRVRPGEHLLAGNGSGLLLEATVEDAEPGRLALRIDGARNIERPSPRIRLVQALAKGDRDEMAVQAATELGVDGVVPWAASRSVTRWEGPKIAKGRDRWRAIVREASKQSIRAWLPEVAELTSTKQLVVLARDTRMLLLEPTAELRLTRFPAHDAGADDQAGAARDIVLVVGPEGGIAASELELLESAGAVRVRLGDTVLRTSTAGPAALALLNAALARW
ncbi:MULTISPECIES: 16S rRNA (uracil(1498)-N(3))-methyltransferase [unclassified Cryobacterium]|uniref:16S rRNA (uracil(1498)-N(3))-methyltransferase n=1 Tax=unclassified Cryobacterium TaxID=2649013 RepID=UPI002AB4E5C6|nr:MULTISPECIES: 16S rRNA (uracil(1498)-N(3))-methyltransferase [unclassified Cryobacterium]MDY7543686.1 16S rRNA (uracil(1498)-N(3))-methyltransferase [Cryobacterium sp. 5B3]MEA9997492.1 16S rRNA (uracil(1498)-N(3))-methyltransferase [Cryobacterium sp. RTS3]MEB0264342.1 16S rRNA (uracil(1498)-N(3))-methyltransferase [Cryobacterium sp. 10I5]MEB0273525.1 16S rRNA (uracil(1498)-N(3))-methyltransferase [Cryobacterium sp. 5B3]